MKFGINLYSLRNQIKTEESFEDTMNKLKHIGYSYVQFSGAPFDAEMIKRVSQKTSMPVVLTHAPIDRLIGDTEKLIDEHLSFGCTNIGLGTIPWKYLADKNTLMEQVDLVAHASKIINEKGLKFFYHNHHVEFYRHDGKQIFEMILERIPGINITLDTYWVQYGGLDLLSTIEKLSGKIGCVHLKDYAIRIAEDGTFIPDYAPLGEGNLDFKKIIPAMKTAGTEYFLVEMDNTTEKKDPFEQVKRCADYLDRV